LAELGQDFIEDATNSDTAMRRNALRHQVMPVLRGLNPSLAGAVLRQSELLRLDSGCLDALAAEAFDGIVGRDVHQVPVGGLLELYPAIASRVVALAVRAAGGAADAVHVRQVLEIAAGDDPSAETTVRGGVTVRRVYDRLVFESRTGFPEKAERFHTFHFKTTAICGKITVRPRRTGDLIRLAGRGMTKTVKKLMIEEKIPVRERESWPILADEAGVIAVWGIGVDERVAPGPGDETITMVVEESSCTKT